MATEAIAKLSRARAKVTRGILVGFTEHGEPLVDYPGNPTHRPLVAISTVILRYELAGKEAVVTFEDDDPRRPILVGILQPPLKPNRQLVLEELGGGPRELTADGESVQITAHKEIVLRCGLASLTLTRDGKVLLRGAYVQSRSSGVNRIKGASVQIN
jgi:hypothetical protein